jgi:hypothetical protein
MSAPRELHLPQRGEVDPLSEAKMDRVGGLRGIQNPPPDAISLTLACADLPALGEVN